MDLTPKERRFVSEYLKDQNATAAAKRTGYSARTADVQGPRLLGKVRVKAAVDAAMVKLEAKSVLTAEKVRAAVYRMLTFDPRQAFNADGTMKDVNSLPDDVAIAIAGIDVDNANGDVTKIRFTDRIRAAELAAKMLGLVQIALTGKNGEPLNRPPVQIDLTRMNDDMLRAIAGMRVNGHGTSS